MSATHDSISLQSDLTADDLLRARKHGEVAVDAEFTGLNPHRDLLCLVQVYFGTDPVIFIRREDWDGAANLRTLFADDSVMKIFHYAVADCTFILKHLGVQVANVYCTKMASKIARTYTGEHGLSALMRELFALEIDKKMQTSDWLAPDLKPAQLEYAANDVLYLARIKADLEQKLKRRGRLPSGIEAVELNERCRAFLPTLVHLHFNGWGLGSDGRDSIFSH